MPVGGLPSDGYLLLSLLLSPSRDIAFRPPMMATRSQLERTGFRLYWRDSDEKIIRQLADKRFMTTGMLSEVLGRNIVSLRARLRQLLENKIVGRQVQPWNREYPGRLPDEFVFFLGTEGLRYAKLKGYIPDVVRPVSFSPKNASHELDLTRIDIALDRAFGRLNFRYRWPEHLFDEFTDSTGKRWYVKPDEFFGVLHDNCSINAFLELERSKSRQGALGRKFVAYAQYVEGPFQETWGLSCPRVMFLFPTDERAENALKKLAALDLAPKIFWVARTSNFISNPRGRIFRTPYDFHEPVLYSVIPDGTDRGSVCRCL